MIDFFRNLNFPRAVILVSLVASCVLGYLLAQRAARLDEIQSELRRTPQLVQEIQNLGIELDQYQQLAKGSNSLDTSDFSTFIRKTAATNVVGIGEVEVIPDERSPARDIVDKTYKIRPATRNQSYVRAKIGNFLYKLEADNPRLKVTDVQMTPAQKIRPGEVGDDRWTFEATVTARAQVGSDS